MEKQAMVMLYGFLCASMGYLIGRAIERKKAIKTISNGSIEIRGHLEEAKFERQKMELTIEALRDKNSFLARMVENLSQRDTIVNIEDKSSGSSSKQSSPVQNITRIVLTDDQYKDFMDRRDQKIKDGITRTRDVG